MCNARRNASHPANDRPRLPFGPHPGWYEAYWYAPQAPAVRSPIDFIVAVIRSAMRLPAEIRRVAERCPQQGESE